MTARYVPGTYTIETGFASDYVRATFPGVVVEVIEWQEWPVDGSQMERTTRITGDADAIAAVETHARMAGVRWSIPRRVTDPRDELDAFLSNHVTIVHVTGA